MVQKGRGAAVAAQLRRAVAVAAAIVMIAVLQRIGPVKDDELSYALGKEAPKLSMLSHA